MTELTTFSFLADEQADVSQDVRVVDRDGKPWFVLRDVLKAMDSSTRPALAKESIEQGLGRGYTANTPLKTAGGTQNIILVSEPAVSYLISRSNTEAGRRLNRWIHEEVIPAIRNRGYYEAAAVQPEPEAPREIKYPKLAGVTIYADYRGRYKLNHVQRAYEWSESASARRRTPLIWIETPEAQAALNSAQECTGLHADQLLSVVNGTNTPGTYAHWLVAVEYAHWLSPKFGALAEKTLSAPDQLPRSSVGGGSVYTVPRIEYTDPDIAAAVTALTELDLAQQELQRCQVLARERLARVFG